MAFEPTQIESSLVDLETRLGHLDFGYALYSALAKMCEDYGVLLSSVYDRGFHLYAPVSTPDKMFEMKRVIYSVLGQLLHRNVFVRYCSYYGVCGVTTVYRLCDNLGHFQVKIVLHTCKTISARDNFNSRNYAHLNDGGVHVVFVGGFDRDNFARDNVVCGRLFKDTVASTYLFFHEPTEPEFEPVALYLSGIYLREQGSMSDSESESESHSEPDSEMMPSEMEPDSELIDWCSEPECEHQ